MKARRFFVAYFVLNPNINLGISLSFLQPNIEIFFPFGFFRIGWVRGYLVEKRNDSGLVFGFRHSEIVSPGKAKIRAITFVNETQ